MSAANDKNVMGPAAAACEDMTLIPTIEED